VKDVSDAVIVVAGLVAFCWMLSVGAAWYGQVLAAIIVCAGLVGDR
jgi:hypothetical protein